MSFNRFILLISLFGVGFTSPALAKFTPQQVKAVYIYRIASFVHWTRDAQMPVINICVPDDSEIREILENITKDKEIRNKPILVGSQNCDVLYISKKESLNMIDISQKQAISISDIHDFVELGGVIELTTLGGRIKPKVNLNNVGEFTISSNFLRVADIVGGDK
ncbi:YfiR family protein [Vibrio atypicus]|jgi:hypothetical protein|uniref:YfiR family protein n=1 Tax=Vibrio atypicus TaxID=558271 RepID=UPI001359A026|nr:YfiR family protein [Vibrio atypicus]